MDRPEWKSSTQEIPLILIVPVHTENSMLLGKSTQASLLGFTWCVLPKLEPCEQKKKKKKMNCKTTAHEKSAQEKGAWKPWTPPDRGKDTLVHLAIIQAHPDPQGLTEAGPTSAR